jgi:hypothetical protein
MKIVPEFLASRPWLLVWLAFAIVIAVWVTVYNLAAKVNTTRMSPQQEAVLLQKGVLP